jgi:UDP-N-acetylmuramoyl-tripeptide--D-alanyl-D-alanine ligase
MPEFSTGKLSKAIDGQLCFGSLPPLGGHYEPAGRIVTDVERVQEEDVFWALPGRQQFAEQAFIRGASGVIVCGRHVEPWAGKYSIQVDDSYAALERLARWSRAQFAGTLISVAGKADVSTTTRAIRTLLSNWFVGPRTENQTTDQIESLLRLAQLSSTDDFEIFQSCPAKKFGAADFGTVSRPDIVVLNSDWSQTHLGQFTEELAENLLDETLRSAKTLIVNGDDQRLVRTLGKFNLPIVSVGRNSSCDLVATDISYRDEQLSFVIEGTRIATHASGRHRLGAVLLAYAVARTMGIAAAEIAKAPPNLAAVSGHCSVAETPDLTLIDDTHHATEDSLRGSLELLSETRTNGRRILACGDIAVDVTSLCRVHRLLASAAVTRFRCDRLVACGTHAKEMQAAAQGAGLPANEALAFESIDDAIDASASWTDSGDSVLVAGHRMSGMREVAQTLLQHSNSVGTQNRIDGPHSGLTHKTIEVQSLVSDLREFDATLPPG